MVRERERERKKKKKKNQGTLWMMIIANNWERERERVLNYWEIIKSPNKNHALRSCKLN